MSTPHEPRREPRHEPDHEDVRESTPGSTGPARASGGMGVSSEWVGHAGPGQEATDGLRDVAPHEREPGDDVPPEQSEGGVEPKPEGLPPKAGYPSKDPRSDGKPPKEKPNDGPGRG